MNVRPVVLSIPVYRSRVIIERYNKRNILEILELSFGKRGKHGNRARIRWSSVIKGGGLMRRGPFINKV